MSTSSQSLPAGHFGPVLRGGRARNGGPDWRLIGTLFGSIVAVLVVAAAGTAVALYYVGTGNMEQVVIPTQPPSDLDGDGQISQEEQEQHQEEVGEVLNVLLVGSDSREGLTREELRAIGTENVGTNLTDTIILVQLDPNRDAAVMLSFPRDLLVTRCDGSRGRINEAYHIGEEQRENGGAACLVKTVTDLTDIPIDHYLRVNLAGFIEVVDAIGGVSFYLEEPLVDRFAGLDLPAGCVTLDGRAALGFVRARHLDNDFGRIARQQRFARELVREATSVGILLQPQRLFPLVASVGRSLETDDRLGLGEMRRIAGSLTGITAEGVETRTVPGRPAMVGGAAYVRIDEEKADQLFQAFRDGELLPEHIGTEGGPVTPGELRPDQVPPIHVLNGSRTTGLAAVAAEALEAWGFTIADVGDADNFGFERTLVIYPPELEQAATLVSEALGATALTPGAPGSRLTVVVGSGFDADDLPTPPPAPAEQPTDARDDGPSPGGSETATATMDEEEPTFRGATESNVQC